MHNRSRNDRGANLVGFALVRLGDQGIAAVTVAISMLLLMGLAALALDGSNLYRERGDVQNAADLAALAAVYESCTGGSDADAIAAGRSQALANGYDDADPQTTVVIAREGSWWRATIDTTVAGSFSKVLGANTLDTGAFALAQCTMGPGPSIFAGGDCGSDPTFDLSGNENLFIGAVHSNTNLKVGGGLNDFTDDVTYVTTADLGGSGNSYPPGSPYQVPWKPWPAGMQPDPSDYAAGGPVEAMYPGQFFKYYTNGDVKIDALTPNGVHVIYGNGKFLFDADNLTKTLTLVVLPASSDKGSIEISKSGLNITAFHDNVLFYTDFWKGGTNYPYTPGPYASKPECGAPAIQMSSQGNTFTGLFAAPRGMIEWNGNWNTLNGGLAAFNLKYNGNNNTMNTLAGLGDPITVLLQ
ncbi:MAG TPA: pilus assembly protein TadG-related protein [Acidimicrobiia bacterium]|nr:pilus assembly protein TadG-related protein [Acidimicrobiia bacterium]